MKKNIIKGNTIIHVTHGIGAQSLLMAKLSGVSGRVYVYNPCQKYVDAIKSSATINGFENRILISPLGISNHSFNGMLVYKNNFPIITGTIQASDYKIPNGFSAMPIKVSSIDELLPNLQNVDILKIHINGDCSNIINGSFNLIKKSKKITIICDFQREKFASFTILQKLLYLGFKIYLIQSDGTLKSIKINELNDIKNGYLLFKK